MEAQSRTEDPSRENRKKDMWARFMPATNVLWLAALLWTLLHRLYKGEEKKKEQEEEAVLKSLRALLGFLEGGGKPESAAAVVVGALKSGLLAKRELEAVRTCLDGE